MREIIIRLSVAQIRAKKIEDKEFYGDNFFGKDRSAYDIGFLCDGADEGEIEEMLQGVLHEILDLIFINKLINKELFVEDLHGQKLGLDRVFNIIKECLTRKDISENARHIIESLKTYVFDLDIRKFVTDAFLSEEIEENLSRVHRIKAALQEEECHGEVSDKDAAVNDLLGYYVKIADKFSATLTQDPLCKESLFMFPEAAHNLVILYSNISENSILHILSGIILEEKQRPSNVDERHKKINHILALLYVLNISAIGRGYIPPTELTSRITYLIDKGLEILQGRTSVEIEKKYFDDSHILYNLARTIIRGNLSERNEYLDRCASIYLAQLESLADDDDDDDFRELVDNLLVMSKSAHKKTRAEGNVFTRRVFHTQRSEDPRKQKYNLSKRAALDIPEESWEYVDKEIEKIVSEAAVSRGSISGKVARKCSGLSNSFMVFAGKPYAVSGKTKMLLGTGRSVIKICQDREGNNYALKIGRRMNDETKLAMRQEAKVLLELGELVGKLSRDRANKEYILIPLELGNNLLDGYISTGIVDLLSLNNEVAIKCMEEVIRLHRRGIIHRDIKPENFMVWFEGGELKVKIIDFGLSAKLAPGHDTGKIISSMDGFEEKEGEIRNVWGGTSGYIAPELLEEPNYSTKTDIFAVGAMFESCLGIEIPELTDKNPELRPSLEQAIAYLKYSSLEASPVSFKEWSSRDVEHSAIGEYRQAESLDFTIAYEMAVEKHKAVMARRGEVAERIKSTCPISWSDDEEITARTVSLVRG